MTAVALMALSIAGCSSPPETATRSEPAVSSTASTSLGEPGESQAPTDIVRATYVARTSDLPTAPQLAADDWPQFRGAARDGRLVIWRKLAWLERLQERFGVSF